MAKITRITVVPDTHTTLNGLCIDLNVNREGSSDMTVLEMMENDVNSVIGLDVSYDFGGTKPIIGQCQAVSKNAWHNLIDGEMSTWYSYSVSFGGAGYYTVDKFTQLFRE